MIRDESLFDKFYDFSIKKKVLGGFTNYAYAAACINMSWMSSSGTSLEIIEKLPAKGEKFLWYAASIILIIIILF